MLSIRGQQIATLVITEAQVSDHVAHLRHRFGTRTAAWSDEDAAAHVRLVLVEAYGFGVTGKRDVRRMLNLSVFARPPWRDDAALAWMDTWMRNARLGTPSRRLKRVFDRFVDALAALERTP